MAENKLNILFISSWYPHKLKPMNGIFVKRHAAANTIDCNVSAIFICSDDSNSIEESVEDGIYTLRGYYKTPDLKIPGISQLVKVLRYFLMWKKVLLIYKRKKGNPNLVNSNIVYPVTIIATIMKFVWGVPYVITEHWTGYFPEDGHYKGFWKKLVSKIAVANSSAVISDSTKLSRTMESLGLIPESNLKNKFFTIPNVVDPELFTIRDEKQVISHQPTAISFIHVSSLDDEHKNITGMIRTFKKFHERHPGSTFTIIWDEEIKEYLDRIKEPFSEKDGVFLQGKTTGIALAEMLQKSDAFLLFSNYENLPCVMLEAFACGIPVIGTTVGDVPDYINSNNGVLIDSKNENQLLEAMETVFRNMNNYNPSEIRNMVLDKISPVAISKQFTDVYKSVLSGQWSVNSNHSNLTTDDLPLTTKLKVLFVSSWYPTKLRPLHGIFVQRHAELLVPQCEVSTVFITSAEEEGIEINTINNVYTVISYFKRVKMKVPLVSGTVKLCRYISAWNKALEIYMKEKGKPDIIQSNVVYPVSIVAGRLSKIWKIPYVILEHWSGYFPRDGRYKGIRLKFLSEMAVKHASAVATVSNSLKLMMLNVNLNNTYCIIPNAVDTRSFVLQETRSRKETFFEFIHVSFEEQQRKNVAGIVRAFCKFHSKFPYATLKMIVDTGEVTNQLLQLAKSLGIEKAISFTGTTTKPELVKMFQDSDAFVLFSDVETQAIILLEALCCGLPVISSRCGGPEEYITPENGLLVDIENEDQLAEAMEEMVKNKDKYNPATIRNSVVNMVSEESVAEKFIQMYSDVLNQK